MNSLRLPKLSEPGVAYGLIAGFPVHDSYPIEDRAKLDQLFRDDYFSWDAMRIAAASFCAMRHSGDNASVFPGPCTRYFVDGWWEYKGRQIVDRGFLLVGGSRLLHDFMQRYDRPYIVKNEEQTDTFSEFSNLSSDPDAIFVGDLQDNREILQRVYRYLRPEPIFGAYTLAAVADSFPASTLGIVGDFLNHIRQNGEKTPVWQDSIVINDERARRELRLFDHSRLKDWTTTNRPTIGSVLNMLTAGPRPPRALIDAAEARKHCREHLRVRGTVTEIEVNRRGDVILGFGPEEEVFRAVIPASCVVSRDEEWINSLKNRTLIVSGLISFYAQKPAMRILENNQVALEEV